MEKHLVGGIIITFALIMYVLTFVRAKQKRSHQWSAIFAVTFDVVGSLIMSSGTPGLYLVEHFENLNIFQIFHLVISPVALIIMIVMVSLGLYKKMTIHKKIGTIAFIIWLMSFFSGFFMIG